MSVPRYATVLAVLSAVVSTGNAAGQQRSNDPIRLEDDRLLELGDRRKQIEKVLKVRPQTGEEAAVLKRQMDKEPALMTRPPAPGPIAITKDENVSEVIDVATIPLMSGFPVGILVNEEASAGASVSSNGSRTGYVFIQDAKVSGKRGWSETAPWQVFGALSSGPHPGAGISVPSTVIGLPDGSVALAGREAARFGSCHYARLSLIDSQEKLSFDQIYSHKDSCQTTINAAIYLPATNEILGVGSAGGSGRSALWLFKFDVESRVMLWQRAYDLGSDAPAAVDGPKLVIDVDTLGRGLVEVEDGFVVVGSVTTKREPRDESVLVLHLSRSGKVSWARACGGKRTDSGYAIKALLGGLVVGASSASNGDPAGWVFKLSPQGSLVWEKRVGRSAIRALGYRSEDSIYVVDSYRAPLALKVSRSGVGSGPNWDGEWAWTRNSPFPKGSGFADIALTCTDIYWKPSVGDALAGRVDEAPSFRDQRMKK